VHVAGTYDGTTYSVYINGVLDGTATLGGTVPVNPGLTFRIGGDSTGANLFVGLIDEVEVYNRGLSAAEVAGLAASTTAGRCNR
jgi:hypothetical protein